jgi:hypothetical protein
MSDYRFGNPDFPAFYEEFPSSSSIRSGFRHKLGSQEWLETELASYPEAKWAAVTYPNKQFQYGSANKDRVSNVIRDHLHRVHCHFYGNAYLRFGRTLGCIPSIERGKFAEEWHFHLLLEIPMRYRAREHIFAHELQYIWQRSGWAREALDIQPCDCVERETGWCDYITKTTWLVDDAIDYNNFYRPNPPQPSTHTSKIRED